MAEAQSWNPYTEWRHSDIDWIRVNISREDLGRFTKRSDLKGLLYSLGFLALIGLTGAAAWISLDRGWWLLLALSLYVHGGFYGFFGAAIHELVHNTVFKSQWLSDLVTTIYAFLYWPKNPYLYRASHLPFHHRYTLHENSDGEDVPNYMQLTPRFVAGLFLNVFHGKNLAHALYRLFTLRPTSYGWRGRGFKLDLWEQFVMEKASEKEKRRIRRIAVMNLILQPLYVAGCILSGLWFLPIITTLAPFYGPRFMGFVTGVHQHCACEANEPDFRISCGDTKLGPLLSFLYWRMEHHIEHHMFAAIPCYNLGPFSRFVADQLPPKIRMLPRLRYLDDRCRRKYGSYENWREKHGVFKGF
jgi:fatty acid desaturase